MDLSDQGRSVRREGGHMQASQLKGVNERSTGERVETEGSKCRLKEAEPIDHLHTQPFLGGAAGNLWAGGLGDEGMPRHRIDHSLWTATQSKHLVDNLSVDSLEAFDGVVQVIKGVE